ncbi:hypothetical protein ABT144_20035 [Streptomyces sp. NPDC002039]|uniref:hypothetical protein n=1 Tax=unclassified Streptomyces TaxID=2593676 RepID=UPI0033180CC5
MRPRTSTEEHPKMSFGDPNNPYGQQQPPQGQPGYGYPQAPQGVPPQGYGYPGGAPAYPGGYPGVPVEMPGGVKGARIMLFILGGCQVIGGIIAMVASAWVAKMITGSVDSSNSSVSSADVDKAAGLGAGIMIFIGLIILGFAVWGILTGVKLGKGRGGIRVSGIVYASAVVLFSLITLLLGNLPGLLSLVLGILIIVFLAKSDASRYFNRAAQ